MRGVEKKYMKKVLKISKALAQSLRTKWIPSKNDLTPDYEVWRVRRKNDRITLSDQENAPSLESMFAPSDLEIAKQEFERLSASLNREKDQLQEVINQLKLDAIISNGRIKEVEKQKDRFKGELGDLQKDYPKLRLTLKNAGLGKTSEEWKNEIADLKGEIKLWKERESKQQGRVKALSQESKAEKSIL